MDTGVFTFEAEVELEPDEAAFGEPLRLELEGPFRSAETISEWPDLDMTFRAIGFGEEYEGRLVTTPSNAWVSFGGETYEVGERLWRRARAMMDAFNRVQPDTFDELDVDPLDWVSGAREEGRERVGGTTATKVTGRLDADRMLRDLNRLPGGEPLTERELRQAEAVTGDTEFEAWIGDDDIWRRTSIDVELRVPEDERDALGGIEGGELTLNFELDDPNEPVDIEGLGEGRPIDELLRSLGIPPESFLGPGFSAPAPG